MAVQLSAKAEELVNDGSISLQPALDAFPHHRALRGWRHVRLHLGKDLLAVRDEILARLSGSRDCGYGARRAARAC
jgi:hypothetical protein